MKPKKKGQRRWPGRLAKAFLVIVFLVLVGAWGLRDIVLPILVRRQVAETLSGMWDGNVRITRVDVSYAGRLTLTGIEIEDDRGRLWVTVNSLQAQLDDWPSLNPRIAEVVLDEARVHLQGDLPLVESKPADPAADADGQEMVVPRVRVRSLLVTAGQGRDYGRLSEVRVSLDRRDGKYLLLVETKPELANRLVMDVLLDPDSGQFEGRARVDRAIEPAMFRYVRSWLAPSLPVQDVRGQLTGAVSFSGNWDDWASAQIAGQGRLLNAQVTFENGVTVNDLQAEWTVADRKVGIPSLSLQALGGEFQGAGQVGWQDGKATYHASGTISGLDLKRVAELLTWEDLSRGRLDGQIELEGGLDLPVRLRAKGDLVTEWVGDPVRKAYGAFNADLTLDTESPVSPEGQLQLDGWALETDESLASQVHGSLTLRGNRIDVTGLGGTLADGGFSGEGRIEMPGQGGLPLRFSGQAQAWNVSGNVLTLAGLTGSGLENIEARFDLAGRYDQGLALQADGSASASLSNGSRRVNGKFDVSLSGLFSEAAPQLKGRLSTWQLREGDGKVAELVQANLRMDGPRLHLTDGLLATEGGQIQFHAQAAPDAAGTLNHQWTFAAENLNVTRLVGLDPQGPDVVLRLEGSASGSGIQAIQARAQGKVSSEWPSQGIEANSQLEIELSCDDLAAVGAGNPLTAEVRLSGGRVTHNERPLLSELTSQAKLTTDGTAVIELHSKAMDGLVRGKMRIAPSGSKPRYALEAEAKDLDLATIQGNWPQLSGLASTAIAGQFSAEGDELASLSVRGEGSAAATFAADDRWQVAGDFGFDTRLEGLGTDRPLQVRGNGRLGEWSVSNRHGLAIENLHTPVRAFGRSVDIGAIRAKVADGHALGLLRMDFPVGGAVSSRGRLAVDNLDLQRLATLLGHETDRISGQMDFAYAFSAGTAAFENVNGQGSLLLRGGKMMGVPMIEGILTAIRAKPPATPDTDLDVTFTNQGALVKVVRGRMGTPVAAASALPDGTVRLDTRELDIHVVAALLDDIEQLSDSPAVKLLAPLTKRLTQLHVTGKWDSRDTITIQKQPLQDIGKATAEFFSRAAEAGGDFDTILIQPFREGFE